MMDGFSLCAATRADQIDPETRDKFIRKSAHYLDLPYGSTSAAAAAQNDTAPSPSRHTGLLPYAQHFDRGEDSERNSQLP
jgi:hypothetical protein